MSLAGRAVADEGFGGISHVAQPEEPAVAAERWGLAPVHSLLQRPTLTDGWFGQQEAMHEAGIDLRIEWNQFYQGLVEGDDDNDWEYGGELDALLRLDLGKIGLWDGLSVTTQANLNYGHSVNDLGGSLIPVNTALGHPAEPDVDGFDVTALFFTQSFNEVFSISAGKFDMVEGARATPLKGGGGVDTFWNTELAAPLTGLIPGTIFGARVRLATDPVSFTFYVFDPTSATNHDVFDDPFAEGVSLLAVPTLKTSIAGLTGYYGVKAVYSTKEGINLTDANQLFLPPEAQNFSKKKGSYYVGLTMQQYLVQDESDPRIGWGLFGELGIADGNPNATEWVGYVGVGGNSFLPGREADRFGIAYFHYAFSKDLKESLEPVFDLNDETGVELFYNWAATPWVHITGDLQFINPGNGTFAEEIFAGVATRITF